MASLFEREAGLLMGPRGAEGRKRISELGIQSLKENTSQARDFQILTTKMKINLAIFPFNFQSWIGEYEI